jgi:hypothetical protein
MARLSGEPFRPVVAGQRAQYGTGMLATMYETAQLAGFFAAHGIWSVSDGAALVPLLGYEYADGSRGMDRFALDDAGDGARAGQEALHANRYGAVRAVLVVDTYLDLDSGRTDALIVEAVEYGPDLRSLKLAVPYRAKPSPQGFAVHRPKFIGIDGISEQDQAALADAFFDGVDSHEQAAVVWNAHLDPSI